MRKFDTKVQYLKYKVLREVAHRAWEDTLFQNLLDIPQMIVPGKTSTMRCCVYKERAILQERVKIANRTENGILLSIHQNYFPDEQYSGAQVFYGKGEGSEALAKSIQSALVQNLNIGSKRKCKAGTGIYLMEHTDCPGVLIECGFLSNENEAKQLQTEEYQKKLCETIIATISCYVNGVDPRTIR